MSSMDHREEGMGSDDTLTPADDVLVAPGEVLKEELDARGWSQKDLATVMGRPAQAISEIITGAKQITPQTALELSEALGTSAELWTNLEADYRLAVARSEWTDNTIERRARMFSLAPVTELLKRGWLPGIGDVADELCRFLGIASLAEEPTSPARLRASVDRGIDSPAIVAWLKRVEILAAHQDLGEFDADGLRRDLQPIAELSLQPARAMDIAGLLARRGVHFVVVPHLPKTFLDGASFVLPSGRPVVAVTLRYDRIDSFWFTVMHELGHILLGHEATADRLFDAPSSDPDEQAASRFAEEQLFPPDRFADVRDALDFAPTIGMVERAAAHLRRHPGLLVGHLQFRTVLGYGQGRHLLVRVSPHLTDAIDRPAAA
jgi:HTH-type transcriptional regulator/antitoxin HigA